VKIFFSVPLVLLTICAGVASAAQPMQDDAGSPAVQAELRQVAGSDRAHVIYVSDFDLDLPAGRDARSFPASPAPPASPTDPRPDPRLDSKAEAKPDARADAKPEAKKEESVAERAARFAEFVSNTLVKELERAGYEAHRLRPGDARPDEGIRISGVFAEPDEQNRLRRAMIGAGPTVGQMALFVSVGNLARPDQPLYAVVDPKTASNNAGPVISVSAYAPVARFEMPKNVTEKSVRDAATSIVTDLTLLLRTSVAGLTR
jgi:Domain of unknown function (DUF4410)